MGNVFRAADVVKMGIEIEKNGRDFYAAMAEQAESPEAAKLFTYLAGEEERHIAVFKTMLGELEQRKPQESYPGEYLAFLRDLAGGHVFTREGSGRELAAAVKDGKEAIDFGIRIEKDSMVFYLGMKEVVPRSDHAVLDALIGEEREHLKRLLELREGG